MTRIAAIAFDVMDTLLTDPFRKALQAGTGLGLAELTERRSPHLWPAFERGELDEAAFWDGFAADGIPCDEEAFHRVRRQGTDWIPGIDELLDELAGRVRRVTASNYPIWIDELAVGVLAGRIDEVIASTHLGARKPDAVFYERLLHRLGLPTSAVLFVDDRQENVDSARELGIASHRFVDAATLRAWLAQHGVDVRGETRIERELAGCDPPQHGDLAPPAREA